MPDCQMNDNEIRRGVRDAVADNDVMLIDTMVEKEQPVPHLPEDAGVAKQESPLCEGDQNPVVIPRSHPVDHGHPDVEDLQQHNDSGHSPRENIFVEPPGTVHADTTADANTNEPHDNSGKPDVANLDPQNQLDSAKPNKSSLETKGEEMKVVESDNGTTGMEVPVENETSKEKSNIGVKVMELPSNNEIKEEKFNNGVTRLELLQENEKEKELENGMTGINEVPGAEAEEESRKPELDVGCEIDVKTPSKSFLLDSNAIGVDESGTEEEQAAFMKEVEIFHKERFLEFKPPRFYGEPLNCLKLWRAVIRLGGYEQVSQGFHFPNILIVIHFFFMCITFYCRLGRTFGLILVSEDVWQKFSKDDTKSGFWAANDYSFKGCLWFAFVAKVFVKIWSLKVYLGEAKVTSCKLWRQVGESFKPPK
ncbi:unnamed protein product [Ilex paraguariensis]|uniref:ARID domain-containing protein n=1 Tax=Ilex paraguariensis TaxID=185542 RepID=A0ABC8RSI9_9AQUA